MISQSASRTRTVSELLFEQYLDGQGVPHEHEQSIPNKRKHPDYLLKWNGHDLVCEVKELYAIRPHPDGAAMFDPYSGIRKKIHKVKSRKQFKEFRDYPCVLVLYNVDDWEFRDRPYVLFGAMLGDLGITMPVDVKRGVALIERKQSAFLARGKMIIPKSNRAQNTTISAIAVLSEFRPPDPAFDREEQRRLAELASRLGRQPTDEEKSYLPLEMLLEGIPRSLPPQPRVCVFENPYASKPLPEDLFRGAFDSRHRWNRRTGKIERLFAG